MPDYNFNLPRLLVDLPLGIDDPAMNLSKDQNNYLANVLRLKAGAEVLLFNGRQGEWLAQVEDAAEDGARKRKLGLRLMEQTRPQTPKSDLRYLFAPLKQARQDYMVQKGVEMGVSALQPVKTDHCQVARVNTDRLAANAREACEQCGVLNLVDTWDLMPLAQCEEIRDGERTLIFCDERAETNNPRKTLESIEPSGPLSVLIGPEGGFSQKERDLLHGLDNAVAIPLGPRILRADTAAVAALAAIQMTIGDWR